MTEPERRLWVLVRNNRLGVKFRRQVPFGHYILDFFCFSAKLAVELDGRQHYTPEGKEYDRNRDAFLRMYGVNVLRFSNQEFMKNSEGVLEVIRECVQKKPSPLPSPGGRGMSEGQGEGIGMPESRTPH